MLITVTDFADDAKQFRAKNFHFCVDAPKMRHSSYSYKFHSILHKNIDDAPLYA